MNNTTHEAPASGGELKEHQGERYTVTIKGPGVQVEQSVPKAALPQLLMMLVNADTQAAAPNPPGRIVGTGNVMLPAMSVSGAGTVGPRLSLAEYLEEVNARRIPERILGMANYLTEVSGQLPGGTFNKSDIKPLFEVAGDPLPANFSRDWQLTVAAGWVAQEPGSPEAFFVTRRGKNAIAERFSGEGSRITRIRRRKRVGGDVVEEQSEEETK